MKKNTLIILAAGMASRYGSLKQIAPFGPNGETILDYTVYDAIRAGFAKIVFIIREETEADFRAIFDPKLNGKIEVAYVFQNLNTYTNGHTYNPDRKKPWGTMHAVLCAKNAVNEPFAVVNADDFYGFDAFKTTQTFLSEKANPNTLASIGFLLKNTVSEYGSVSRGVCVAENGHIKNIVERTKIYSENNKIWFEDGDLKQILAPDTIVSMNFWGFHHSIFSFFQSEFNHFLDQNSETLTTEFVIPGAVENFIQAKNNVAILYKTSSEWFGVTYKEDNETVKAKIISLIETSEYPANLWNL
jgi:NDP-sugar pyrophosphorylase family protein